LDHSSELIDDNMLIEDIQIKQINGDRIELSAMCDGHSLHYRLPASRFCRQAVGDAVVLSTLAPAMRAGSTIRLPDGIAVSSRLAANLDGIQRVYMSWNDRLKKVRLESTLYEPVPAPVDAGVALFYAGGVDSSYSLISHLDEVDALIIAFGFDHTMSDVEIANSLDRNGRFARRFGKELVAVETNHSRFVRDLGVSRTFIFGATLASSAVLLGLRRCYIASSHSAANVMPDGSNPVLDHRFSNGVTEIIHDDVSVTRLDKTWGVARRKDILENLRVCWELPNENCGVCPKCVRTMTALRLCGATGPFPPLDDVRRISAMAAHSEVEYVVSMIMAAHAKGERAIERELRKGLRGHDWNEALRYFDQALLGGRLRQLRRRYRDAEADLVKIELRPDLDLR
jgi:7-cyano-7-deazaguanine synthase in queuosine biosynthesis